MLEIVLEDDVFVTEDVHLVDTKIHLKYNDYCFPNKMWTDFTFPILEEWKNNLIRARNLCNTSFLLYFHDGSYAIRVNKDDKMMLTVECIETCSTSNTELVFHCGYYEFLHVIYGAMKSFLKILFANNMQHGKFSSVYRQTLISIRELKVILAEDEDAGTVHPSFDTH